MLFETCDVLIIGCGVAGLTLALRLPQHLKIIVLAKDDYSQSASYQAQGGIASVQSPVDSFDDHISDSLTAAAGLANLAAVTLTVQESSQSVQWLLEQGVDFNFDNDVLHLLREGGHSHPRVVHVNDATGMYIMRALQSSLSKHANVSVYSSQVVVDLLVENRECNGVEVFDVKENALRPIFAKTTVLATGGASGLYKNTTNANSLFGDGIAMAWRAGCEISNMEFVQFHPTCLYDPINKPFLITEAARGHGGLLKSVDGRRFMLDYDARAELATRDIVSKAIYLEMQASASPHVYLDLTHINDQEIHQYFPTIFAVCQQRKIDITKNMIPVMPAAHYTCGGIVTDFRAKTALKRLYAIGEVACTGLHGANRLASNSLLEGVVFATKAAQDIALNIGQYEHQENKYQKIILPTAESNFFKSKLDILRELMWDKVGIVRCDESLMNARTEVAALKFEFNKFFTKINGPIIDYRNALDVAGLIIEAALQRKESRGCHFRADYPSPSENFVRNSVFFKQKTDKHMSMAF